MKFRHMPCLFAVLSIAGCADVPKPIIWPDHSLSLDTFAHLNAWPKEAQQSAPSSILIFQLGGSVDDDFWSLTGPVKVNDPSLASEVIVRIYSADYQRHPMFTLRRPIYVIAIDRKGSPVGACRVNDAYLQPIAVRCVRGSWQTRDLFGGELKHHAANAGVLESRLRQHLALN